MKIGYHKELDGVRGIAALMVMFFHFAIPPTTNPILLGIKKMMVFGQTGVSLFFVLSGFLITRILIASKSSEKYFVNFYIRRSLRIFPLYFFFLAIWYFLLPLTGYFSRVGFSLQWPYWVYMQDFAMTFNWPSSGPGHFWSLAVEEHFYLFWPLLIYWLNKRGIVIASFSIILISLLVRIFLVSKHYEVFYLTFSRMDELAVGALLAILEMNRKLSSQHANKFIALFVIVLVPTVALWIANNSSGNPILQVFKFILLSMCYFSLIGYVIAARSSNLIKRFFSSGLLRFTGKVSYGLYVYHPVCFVLFSAYMGSRSLMVNFFGSFLFAYAVAMLSYYLFEQHFLKLKDRFSGKG